MKKLFIIAVFVATCMFAPSQSKAQSFQCDNKSGCQYTPPPGCSGAACNPQWIQDGGNLLGDAVDKEEEMFDWLFDEGFQLMFPPVDYFRAGTPYDDDEWIYDYYVGSSLDDPGWSMF